MMTQLDSTPQPISDTTCDYSAFLLRIWQKSADGWQASLEDIHSGVKQEFANPEQLLAQLAKQLTPR